MLPDDMWDRLQLCCCAGQRIRLDSLRSETPAAPDKAAYSKELWLMRPCNVLWYLPWPATSADKAVIAAKTLIG